MIHPFSSLVSAKQRTIIFGFFIIALSVFWNLPAQAQVVETQSPASASVNRERGLRMLDDIEEVLKEYYYDPKFRGINLDEKIKASREKIKKLDANWQIFRVIAQVLLDFQDSHTRFYPPARFNRVQYGFSMQMIGSKCFVVSVTKGSDAEAKGLKVGDTIWAIGEYAPARENLRVLKYLLYSLDPQEAVTLGIQSVDGTKKQVTINAKFISPEELKKEQKRLKEEKKQKPFKCAEISTELKACKLYTFSVEKKVIDKMMKETGSYKKLILDLRGNTGGFVNTLQHLTGYFFYRDVKIGTEIKRTANKELIAKSLQNNYFNGELIILIDSDSASASEVFARTLQLEKRAKIVGDVSAGAVMVSRSFPLANQRGVTYSFFDLNVTVADLAMSDGSRLENTGVIPDIPVIPTGRALSIKADPILSHSVSLLGGNLSAEQAGNMYFLTEKTEEGSAAAEESEDER